jgi:competence protein ComEA
MGKWFAVTLVLAGMLGMVLGGTAPAWCADTAVVTESASTAKINLNTATTEQLTALPGVGETIAGAIVVYRDNNGAFRSVEELLEVKGIGEKKLIAISEVVILE